MIDIHCHILPGVDDGAKDWDEALEMARIAEADGIKTIISTSHFIPEGDFKTGEKLKEIHSAFQEALVKENISLEVLLGNEAYIVLDLAEKVADNKVYTIHNSRYLLLEFPFQSIPLYAEDVLYELRLRGIIPIIAHPERYTQVMENPMVLYPFIQQGALTQLNGSSLLGKHGAKVQQTAEILLKHNMIHFLGSDAHSTRSRKPKLREAFEAAAQLIGREEAEKLVYHHAKAVLADQELAVPEPIRISSRTNKGFLEKLQHLFRGIPYKKSV